MKLKILLLILILSCYNEVFSQDELKTTRKKKVELYSGISLREAIHLGVLFGNKTSYGGFVGYLGSFRFGINLKHNFRGRSHYADYSPWFMRSSLGVAIDKSRYYEDKLSSYPYLDFTIGRNLYFNPNWGSSLEAGIWLPGYEGILPAVSLKVFYHIYK